MRQGVHVDPERLHEWSVDLGRFAANARELIDAILRDIFARVEQLEQVYARVLERSLHEEDDDQLEDWRSIVAAARELRAQLWEAAQTLRRTLETATPAARAYLRQLAADIEAFQHTPLPSEGASVAAILLSAPAAGGAGIAANAGGQGDMLTCPQHHRPLQPCPKCGGKGYTAPAYTFLNPERLFAAGAVKEQTKELPRCAACDGQGRYCPLCAGETDEGANQ